VISSHCSFCFSGAPSSVFFSDAGEEQQGQLQLQVFFSGFPCSVGFSGGASSVGFSGFPCSVGFSGAPHSVCFSGFPCSVGFSGALCSICFSGAPCSVGFSGAPAMAFATALFKALLIWGL